MTPNKHIAIRAVQAELCQKCRDNFPLPVAEDYFDQQVIAGYVERRTACALQSAHCKPCLPRPSAVSLQQAMQDALFAVQAALQLATEHICTSDEWDDLANMDAGQVVELVADRIALLALAAPQPFHHFEREWFKAAAGINLACGALNRAEGQSFTLFQAVKAAFTQGWVLVEAKHVA